MTLKQFHSSRNSCFHGLSLYFCTQKFSLKISEDFFLFQMKVTIKVPDFFPFLFKYLLWNKWLCPLLPLLYITYKQILVLLESHRMSLFLWKHEIMKYCKSLSNFFYIKLFFWIKNEFCSVIQINVFNFLLWLLLIACSVWRTVLITKTLYRKWACFSASWSALTVG